MQFSSVIRVFNTGNPGISFILFQPGLFKQRSRDSEYFACEYLWLKKFILFQLRLAPRSVLDENDENDVTSTTFYV